MSLVRGLRRICVFGLPALPLLTLYVYTSALASQLLLNGGFEEGGPLPDQWQSYGGALARASSPARSGSYSAALTTASLPTKWIYQTVAVTGGNPYTLSGYALKNEPQVESVFLRIAWYTSADGTGPEIFHADSTQSLTDDSPEFRPLSTGSVVAPAQARSARVMGVVRPLSTSEATVYFDDFSLEGEVFTPTPTPSPTSTPSPTLTPTPTATPTPSATPTPWPTATPTLLPSPIPTSSASPTSSPTPTPSPTPISTSTLAPSPSESPTATPTSTPSASPTPINPTPTSTSSPTPEATPSATATPPAGALGSQGQSKILISEVMVDPTQNPEAANEWVELYNPTSQGVDLAGWVLADNFSAKALPQINLGPRSYVVVAARPEVFLAANPDFVGLVVESPGRRIGNGLSNQADMLVLQEPSGQLADSVNWGRPQASWPNFHSTLWNTGLPPPAPGRTLARVEGQEASLSLSAWASSPRPSPGRANPFPEATASPSPTATRASLPSPTITPSATSTRTPTPAARPTSTPTVPTTRVGVPTSGPMTETSPSPTPPLLVLPPISSSPATPTLGGIVLPTAGSLPGQTPVATAPASILPSSLPIGKALVREQDTLTPAAEGRGVPNQPLPPRTAGGPNVVVLLLMALPLLGVGLWLKDRLFP